MSNLTILPPLSGTVRNLGFQQSKPFTSPDMVNFVPFAASSGRAVLAARPYLTNFTSPGVGVNLLELVSGDNPGDPAITMVAAVDGALYFWTGSAWTAATIDAGEVITTGRPVFGASFFGDLYIANDTGSLLRYDYETNTLETPTATDGSFPVDTRVVAIHMGTLWAAGSEETGHILYGSRTGDPTRWDFTDTDEGAPFQTTGDNSGLLTKPITALIPIASDMMVVASESGMFSMLGHPSRGGLFFPLSTTIGVLGQGAWCKSDDNKVFAMSHKGLIQIEAQGDGVAALVSEAKLPNSLKGIAYNRLNPTISLAYDTRWNGIHIVVNDPDQPQAWWYDMKQGGFFRQSYGDDLPTRLLQFDSLVDFTKSGVLYAGTGYGGMARWTVAGPEAARPNAWAFLGPVRLHGQDGPQTKSKITRAKLTLTNDTDFNNGVCTIYTGADGEDAFVRAYNVRLGTAATLQASTCDTGSGAWFPRLMGSAAVVVLGDEGSGEFGFESLDLEVVPAGRNRLPKARGLTYDIEFGIDDYSPELNLPAVTGYATYQPVFTLSTSVTDCPNFIDLSQMPIRWWRGIASSDGREIIATDTSNNRLPMHILHFDRSTKTGMVVVKLTQDGTDAIRLWTNTSQAAIPAAGDTYGQYAAYPSWMYFNWALGDGVDVTTNQDHFSALTSAVGAVVDGPGGFKTRTLGVFTDTITLGDFGSKTAIAFLSKKTAQGQQVVLAFQNAGATVQVSLIRDQGTGEGPRFFRTGTTIQDDTVFPASGYNFDWAFLGAIFDDTNNLLTLSSPVLVTTGAVATALPTTPHTVAMSSAAASVNVAQLQILNATNNTQIVAYFEMMHAQVDGSFYGVTGFVAADEADINE